MCNKLLRVAQLVQNTDAWTPGLDTCLRLLFVSLACFPYICFLQPLITPDLSTKVNCISIEFITDIVGNGNIFIDLFDYIVRGIIIKVVRELLLVRRLLVPY